MTIIDKLRKPRIFGLAIFDWVFSLLGLFLIGKFLIKLNGIREWIIFTIFWILLGIVVHMVMKIPTMLNYYLGLSEKPKNVS
jgi:hypothetical protein